MGSVTLVLVITVVTFAFGVAGAAIFGPIATHDAPVTLVTWVVRVLIGLAWTRIALGIYHAAREVHFARDISNLTDPRGVILASEITTIIDYAGLLIGLATLIHVLHRATVPGGGLRIARIVGPAPADLDDDD